MGKIRALLADDHTMVRQGFRRILEAAGDIEIVAEVGDGRSALEAAARLSPDVAILDITLPELNGIEVTRQLAKNLPSTRVLILSIHADDGYIRHALHAGARGYLLKDADDQDLLRAVAAVATGGTYFSPTVGKTVLESYLAATEEQRDELDLLSDREREILQLIAEGKSNKEAARVLDIAVSTIESHRKHLMDKLDLHNTAELVRFALRKGIIE